MKHKKLSVLLSLIIAACMLFAGLSALAASYKTVSGSFNYSYASEVLSLVNKERSANGLKPVVMTQSLTDGAMLRAAETAVSFSHTRPNGEQCFTAFEWTRAAGENIAYGQTSPEQVMNGWMNSSGHRANILNSSFTTIGIGCFEYGGRLYWAQAFSGGSGQSYLPSGRQAVSVDVSFTAGAATLVHYQSSTTAQSTTKAATTAQSSTAQSTTRQTTARQSTTKQTTTRQSTTKQSTTKQSTTRQTTTKQSTTSKQSSKTSRSIYSIIKYYFRYYRAR